MLLKWTIVLAFAVSNATSSIDTDVLTEDAPFKEKTSSSQTHPLPNIILFMADDLGIGDVGCFGNATIRTPNIDQIAKEGAKLSQHLAPSSICTPSRAAFLTGRYPIRLGMVPTHVVRVNIFVSSTGGLPPEEITFAELAKKKGYKTGLIGKWHLGLHCSNSHDYCHHPLNQGFDYFYGIPLTNLKDFGNDGHNVLIAKYSWANHAFVLILLVNTFFFIGIWTFGAVGPMGFVILMLCVCIPIYIFHWIFDNMKLLNSIMMRNYDVVEQPLSFDNLTQRLVQEGQEFMLHAHRENQPFLLVMSWIQVHTVLHCSKEFLGKSKHGLYGDNVEELDWGVGEILNTLDTLGLTNETFIYLTSDNGGHIEETGLDGSREGGHNGIFRGGKGQGGMEGGIRVPTVARWPGHIPVGIDVTLPTSIMDVLPTLTTLWGDQVPQDRVIDGQDLMPALTGSDMSSSREYMFHYCGQDIHSARYITKQGSDVYKVHFSTYKWHSGTEGCGFMCNCYGSDVVHHYSPLLFNIARDPAEKRPLDVTTSEHKAIINRVLEARDKHVASIEPVVNQYAPHRMIPRPWLQPCCNFPVCLCRDHKYLKRNSQSQLVVGNNIK